MNYLEKEFENLRLDDVEELNKQTQEKLVETKNPASQALTPREYQYEIFKEAVKQNTIAVLDTGAGKTLISVMLIKHMRAIEDEKYQASPTYKRKITFFLVERVPLVFQQANVLEANCDSRIEKLCGEMKVDVWSLEKWRSILDNVDICVMTAQIFLDILQRAFLSLDEVNLMIFDECHHAVKNHAYNLIMYQFYHSIAAPHRTPKIFGMTASPVFSTKKDIYTSITVLETNLDCKVYTAKNTLELKNAIKKASEPVIYYSMKVIDDLPPQIHSSNEKQPVPLRYNGRTILTTLIESKIGKVYGYEHCLSVADYISNNLGPWCSDKLWREMLQGSHIHGLYTDSYAPSRRLSSDESDLIRQAYELCTPASPNPDIRNERLFTPKVKELVHCLKAIHIQPNFCGIIFVERRHTAKSIKILIEALDDFRETIRCDILIGHGGTSRGDVRMKFHDQNSVIQKFRKGELNLLIATSVAEEGLDIQSCNYVIRFDLFKTLPAYIQSRGRARCKDSKYILMINSLNKRETDLLNKFKLQEDQMKQLCKLLPEERNVAQLFDAGEEMDTELIKQTSMKEHLRGAYKIPKTNALLTLSGSIALVYHYCATLPSDEFCQFKPVYRFEQLSSDSNNPLFRCILTLPINSVQQQFEACGGSKDTVKRKISLDACVALHKIGAIDDNLVPTNKKIKMNIITQERDEDGKQVGSRGRENVYPKKIPSFYTKSTRAELLLSPYYISFIEIDDANYRKLCLITKNPIPVIPNITLSNGKQVRITAVTRFIFQKIQQVELLADYMLAVTRSVTNKEFKCPRKDVPYYIVPLEKNNQAFDWKEIKRSITNKNLPLDLNDCKDIIVCASDSGKKYFANGFESNVTPNSIMPKNDCTFFEHYQSKRSITIKDLNQPLLSATQIVKNKPEEEQKTCYLIPELCQAYSISASVYRSLETLPLITSHIDIMLIAQDVKQLLKLDTVKDSLMAEAYIASSSGIDKSYQRLEFLGDSVLKLISSTLVFTQNVHSNEDALTESRMLMISNKALFETAKKLQLYQYIYSQHLSRRFWRPPHFKTDADSEQILKNFNFHTLSDKTLADVIESTLGAAYISDSSLSVALRAAIQLGVPLRNIRVWSDFHKTFKRPLSRYDATLREVNVQRVTDIIGYEFKDPSLLVEALTHASVPISSVPCYQRLEFLGDAVLDFCVTIYLFRKYGTAPPGQLHNLRKSSVNNNILSVLCVSLKLHGHIRHASDYLISEMKFFVDQLENITDKTGEYWLDLYPPKVLSDVIESIIGAVYTDCGFKVEPVINLIEKLLEPLLEKHISLELMQAHPVEELFCIAQTHGCTQCVTRNITQSIGLQKCVVFIHQKAFTSGTGFNTREARKQAAIRACELLTNETFAQYCDCRTPSY